jgi:hypothetical protein
MMFLRLTGVVIPAKRSSVNVGTIRPGLNVASYLQVDMLSQELPIPMLSIGAYSGASRHLIPFESATQFRFIPPPDSGGFRHGNPAQTATPRGGISDAG